MIVLDASVLTDFLLGRHQAIEAIERQLVGHEHDPLHVPDLIEPETLNALRGLARAGKITDQRAEEAVEDLGRVRLVRYPPAPLRRAVWGLGHNLTAYDATYLALAQALGDAFLLTADAGLAAAASRSIGAGRVRHIG